jgi:long-subunit acyl-CoA synthetase (AMP-forming)
MSDWLLYARQYASSRIVREHETDQVGLMLTSSEIIVSNENGVQVAPLHQIARVGKDVGQLLIVSSEQELIRATVDLSTETLGAFFAEAREVAAQARVAATEKAKLAEQTKQRAEREAQAKLEAERLQAQRVADEKKVLEENQKFGRTPGVAASVRPEDLMARGE